MKHIILLLGCLLVWSSGAQAGELYRWVDDKGKVHYGDVPPLDAAEIERKKLSAEVVPSEDMPYETRRAMQHFPVVLYVAENCAEYCRQARDLLSKRGIPFSEKMLVTQEDADALKALSGSDSVPTLAVGKSYLKGFLESAWHNELDIAGYPKTAPYRVSKSGPAASGDAASQVTPENPAAQ